MFCYSVALYVGECSNVKEVIGAYMSFSISIYKQNAGVSEDALVTPDVVHNRFGSVYGSYTMLLLEREDGQRFYIPFHLDGCCGTIGICLVPLLNKEIKALVKFVFAANRGLKQLLCEYSLARFPAFSRNHPTNQWHVTLPQTVDQLWQRMSSKSKQTLRRKKNNLTKELDAQIQTEHYTIDRGIPEEIVAAFFDFKKQLMDRDYNMTAQEYLKKYFVTDAYVWKSQKDGQILSMVFTCEQGSCVYLENLSYNPLYQKESPGFLLYSEVVEELIKKGKKEFFLGRKSRDYKQKFGSQNTLCYDVVAFRSLSVFLGFALKKLASKILRKK